MAGVLAPGAMVMTVQGDESPSTLFRAGQSPYEVAAEVGSQVGKSIPAATALILTGSTARGESTLVHTGKGTTWLSDMEFLVVVRNPSEVRQTAAGLRQLAAKVQRQLAEDAGVRVSVELTPAPERYFASMRPHLFGYELLRHGKQLFGSEDYLSRIPRFSWAEIPREDAWRLLSNRMVEWLSILVQQEPEPVAAQFYSLAKQYLDLITSLSLFSGHYEASYRERAAAETAMAAWMEDEMGELLQLGVIEAARIAARFKLAPQDPAYQWLWREGTSDLRSRLESAGWGWLQEHLPRIMLGVWGWELARISGRSIATRADALAATREVYGWRDWVRGWGGLILRPERRAGGAFWRRAPRLAAWGTPRSLVYFCAGRLLESYGQGNREELEAVQRHLPMVFGKPEQEWRPLASQCVQNWHSFLRMTRA